MTELKELRLDGADGLTDLGWERCGEDRRGDGRGRFCRLDGAE